uniref:RRM domain-containing protein n=1 Tax=Ditylenchus dipsaci TaxID=166011 RepID=A0A915EV87_9BILA
MKIENSEKLEQDGLQSNDGQDIEQVVEKVVASPEQMIKQENSLEINAAVAEEFGFDDTFKPAEESVAVMEDGASSVNEGISNGIGCAIAEQVSSEDVVKSPEGSVAVLEEGSPVVGNAEGAVKFEEKKLFVASLSVHTTHCHVATDKMTGMTRCFGFVTFSSSEAVEQAINSLPHEIDGRQADVKRAVPFRPKVAPIDRLFLGGLRPEHTKDVLLDYFSKYGTVTKVDIAINSATGQSRGFGFIFFESSDVAEECLKNPTHMVAGAECRVKKAVEKQQMGRVFQGRNFYGHDQSMRGGYGTPGYRPSPRGGWNSGGEWLVHMQIVRVGILSRATFKDGLLVIPSPSSELGITRLLDGLIALLMDRRCRKIQAGE